jgi:hypothetical protein
MHSSVAYIKVLTDKGGVVVYSREDHEATVTTAVQIDSIVYVLVYISASSVTAYCASNLICKYDFTTHEQHCVQHDLTPAARLDSLKYATFKAQVATVQL